MTYGNGTFAAVAFGTVAATSPDGITWTQRTMPATGTWQSVTYGNGTFVAIATNSNIAATSTDGVTWTQRTLPATADWHAVTYGDGTFVAVEGSKNIAFTSTDGVTWTQRTLPVALYWRSVTYGNGTFVAMAQSSNIAITSDSTLQFLPLSGETASTLNLTGLTADDEGDRYRVVVDSPSVEPVTSDVATLTPPPITFTQHPQSIQGDPTAGSAVSFYSGVSYSGSGSVSYQWYYIEDGVTTAITQVDYSYSSPTSSSYRRNVQACDAYRQFFVRATDSASGFYVDSNTATFTGQITVGTLSGVSNNDVQNTYTSNSSGVWSVYLLGTPGATYRYIVQSNSEAVNSPQESEWGPEESSWTGSMGSQVTADSNGAISVSGTAYASGRYRLVLFTADASTSECNGISAVFKSAYATVRLGIVS